VDRSIVVGVHQRAISEHELCEGDLHTGGDLGRRHDLVLVAVAGAIRLGFSGVRGAVDGRGEKGDGQKSAGMSRPGPFGTGEHSRRSDHRRERAVNTAPVISSPTSPPWSWATLGCAPKARTIRAPARADDAVKGAAAS
jgi:hypothetical protein